MSFGRAVLAELLESRRGTRTPDPKEHPQAALLLGAERTSGGPMLTRPLFVRGGRAGLDRRRARSRRNTGAAGCPFDALHRAFQRGGVLPDTRRSRSLEDVDAAAGIPVGVRLGDGARRGVRRRFARVPSISGSRLRLLGVSSTGRKCVGEGRSPQREGDVDRALQQVHVLRVHQPPARGRRRRLGRQRGRRLRQRARGDHDRPVQDRKINRDGPWKTLADVELATLEWVDWYNHARLHSACGWLPPVEYEQLHQAALETQ
jgi:transposase InsO family protein